MTYVVVGLAAAVVIVGLYLLGWGLIVFCEEFGPWAGVPAVTLSLAAVFTSGLVLVAALTDDTIPHRHEWDGGSGPATRCHYENDHRVAPVGKVMVPQDQLVTVCEDAR